MDFDAINMSSDEDFKQLGLCKKGDMLSLKSFSKNHTVETKVQSKNEKKRLLQSILQLGQSSKRIKTSSTSQKEKAETSEKKRKVNLGWLNFDEKNKTYIHVRAKNGGGTRMVDIPVSADKDTIILIGKEIFFPDGESLNGKINDFSFSLSNFKCEELQARQDSGKFTLQEYIDKNKMKRIVLYITTKKKQVEEAELSSDSDGSGEGPYPPNEEKPTSVQPQDHSALQRRRSLIVEQDKAFRESLEVDMAKEESKRSQLLAELTNAQHQEKLMNARISRVPDEPDEGEEKVNVHVRHVTLGIMKRFFDPFSRMSAVYDWVGSLSLTPEHFVLTDFEANVFAEDQPITDVSSVVLYMREKYCDDEYLPANEYDNDHIDCADDQSNIDKKYILQPIELIPSRIMEGDER